MFTTDNKEAKVERRMSKMEASSDPRILRVFCKSRVGLDQVKANNGDSIFVVGL